MNIFATIYNRLANDEDVSTIVSDRIYTSVGVDAIWPQVIVHIDKQEDDANDLCPVEEYIMTVTASALGSSAQRADLADAIDACLNRQTWQDDETGIAIRSILRKEETEDHIVQDSGNANRIYYYTDLEYRLGAEETSNGS